MRGEARRAELRSRSGLTRMPEVGTPAATPTKAVQSPGRVGSREGHAWRLSNVLRGKLLRDGIEDGGDVQVG
jgi:hypothetical protein